FMRPEARDLARYETDPPPASPPRRFFTRIEEKLHAETNAETRQSIGECGAQLRLCTLHGGCCGAKSSNTRKNEAVGFHRHPQIGLDRYIPLIRRDRLQQRVEVPCAIIEDREACHVRSASASR